MKARLTLFLYAHELASMDEYSTTLPSATTIGKVWKSHVPPMYCSRDCDDGTCGKWSVGMYVEHENPELVRVFWFEVVLRHGPAPQVYRAPDWSNFAAWKAERARERALEKAVRGAA